MRRNLDNRKISHAGKSLCKCVHFHGNVYIFTCFPIPSDSLVTTPIKFLKVNGTFHWKSGILVHFYWKCTHFMQIRWRCVHFLAFSFKCMHFHENVCILCKLGENACISMKMCTFLSKCTHFHKNKISDLAPWESKVFLSKDNEIFSSCQYTFKSIKCDRTCSLERVHSLGLNQWIRIVGRLVSSELYQGSVDVKSKVCIGHIEKRKIVPGNLPRILKIWNFVIAEKWDYRFTD